MYEKYLCRFYCIATVKYPLLQNMPIAYGLLGLVNCLGIAQHAECACLNPMGIPIRFISSPSSEASTSADYLAAPTSPSMTCLSPWASRASHNLIKPAETMSGQF